MRKDPTEIKETPKRIRYAVEKLTELGLEIAFQNSTEIHFIWKGERVRLFAYTGWFTGKSVKDGRGIHNLLKQLQ